VVVKTCAKCGAPFESKAHNAKRCPSCRPGHERPAAAAPSVLTAVEAQLAATGKATAPLGAAAVVLAARLDLGADTGSGMAAMAKELRTIVAELARAAPAVNDQVDELRKRRKARLHG